MATKYDWPAADDRSLIGKRHNRVDGPAKARGAAKYSYDRNLDGMLYAKLVTSTVPHGRIVGIDTSRAEKAPGLFCEHLRPVVQRLLGGVSDEVARERLKDFTMEGAAENITCPTLITHGADDRLMDVNGARRLHDAIGSPDKTLQIYEDASAGGAIHCSHDYWAHNVPFMLDWMQDRL